LYNTHSPISGKCRKNNDTLIKNLFLNGTDAKQEYKKKMTAILRYTGNLYYSDILEIKKNNMNEGQFLIFYLLKKNINIIFLLKRTNKISGRKNIANILIISFKIQLQVKH